MAGNGDLRGCLLALASGQLGYKGVPSLRPGFHGGLFLRVLQGAVPAREEKAGQPGGGLGGTAGKVRDSRMLAEHVPFLPSPGAVTDQRPSGEHTQNPSRLLRQPSMGRPRAGSGGGGPRAAQATHLMEFRASCLRVLRSAFIPPMPMKAS